MRTKKFLDILQKGIEIPKIQRDYAQGREEELIKLENFLKYIKSNLENKVFLDFIYGTSKEKFIPIDGQQRLTTLFLIYFYVSLENEFLNEFNNFTYEIRTTSRDFIKELVKNWGNLKKDKLKEQIINSNWFFASWLKDPTINAILNAFEIIENYFKDIKLKDLENIEFKFLDLEEFKLDEELYVKMNARGKPLNNFQNFKAEFEKKLKPYSKFDNEWLDFFWKKVSTQAEDSFYQFLSFLAEMLYYQNNTETFNNDFYSIVDILVENNEFLIEILDNLEKIDDELNKIRNIEMFSIEKIENLWSDGFKNISQKIIVFSLIKYILEYKDSLIPYIRFIRNILLMDKKYDLGVKYHQTIAIKDIKTYLQLFLELRAENFYQKLLTYDISFRGERKRVFIHEQEKAKLILKDISFEKIIQELEDFIYFKGNISNVLVDDIKILNKYNQAIKEIFDNEDSLIIRAWYSLEDFSIELDGWTSWGKRYYFGRAPYWDIILQSEQNKEALKKFLDKFLEDKDLNKLIYHSSFGTLDYYVIKYKEFSEKYTYKYISNDLNILIYDSENFLLEKLNNNNLIGYHVNPFIYTIGKKLEKYEKQFAYPAKGDELSFLELGDKGYIVYKVDEKSFIQYKDDFEIKRWHIKDFKDDIIEEMIIEIEKIIS